MGGNDDTVLVKVADYYSEKLAEHGQTARGVDWNDEGSQTLRFDQLSKVIDCSKEFTVNDLGCGYGGYYDYLRLKQNVAHYNGFDLSAAMIAAAEQRFLGNVRARFFLSGEPQSEADYGIASGIFNVRLDTSDEVWHTHILQTLDVLHATSRAGFAFNCLTSYSDPDRKRDYLYYANPAEIFDHCKLHYSRDVALLHDYGLYEFTILVRKA